MGFRRWPVGKKNTAFKLMDTHGVPFEMLLRWCKERMVLLPVCDIYRDARKAGWTSHRITSVIVEGVRMENGPENAALVAMGLRTLEGPLGVSPPTSRRSIFKETDDAMQM